MCKMIEPGQNECIALTEKNYWADNSYCLDLEVTIYSQWFNY